jgi:hypothetical protein
MSTVKRIRLKFEPVLAAAISGDASASDASYQAWFLIPQQSKVVGDVAVAICESFDLVNLCPLGLVLWLEDAELPPAQVIRFYLKCLSNKMCYEGNPSDISFVCGCDCFSL